VEERCAVCGEPAYCAVEDEHGVRFLCRYHVLRGFALGALLSALRNLGEVGRGEEEP
jgi:hypothetical protein